MRRSVLLLAVALMPFETAFASEKKPQGTAAILQGTAGIESQVFIGFQSPAAEQGPQQSSGRESGGGAVVVVGFSPHSCVPIWSGLPERGGFPLDYTFSDNAGADCVSFAAPAPGAPAEPAGAPEVSVDELVEAAVDEAISLAVAPDLVVAPQRSGITGLRSYFWLRSTPPPVSATASVPGLSVTAEAYPVRYVWSFGEGAERSTSHSGRAWTKRRAGNVGHMYETKGTYDLTVQVVYEARWRVGSGAWNELGYFTTSDSRPYRVREVRAYLTNTDD